MHIAIFSQHDRFFSIHRLDLFNTLVTLICGQKRQKKPFLALNGCIALTLRWCVYNGASFSDDCPLVYPRGFLLNQSHGWLRVSHWTSTKKFANSWYNSMVHPRVFDYFMRCDLLLEDKRSLVRARLYRFLLVAHKCDLFVDNAWVPSLSSQCREIWGSPPGFWKNSKNQQKAT